MTTLKKSPEGYEGKYTVTTDGDIFKILKSGKQKLVNRKGGEFNMNQTVKLSKDGKQSNFSVPKLIFETFARKDRYKNPDGSSKQLRFTHKDGNSKNNAYSNIDVSWVDEPTKQKYLYAMNDFRLEIAKKDMTLKQKASIKLLPSWIPGLEKDEGGTKKWRWLNSENSSEIYSKKSAAAEADEDIKDWVGDTKLVSFLNDATNKKMYIRFKKKKNNKLFEKKYLLGNYKLKQLKQLFDTWKLTFA